MATRKLRNAGRRQAAFGAESAAILAAAGINAATQLAAAGINSSATKQAASEQAKAINSSATRQAQAVKDQTQRSKEYQQESQEFIKEQNAENRELQKDIQMQLQMLTGQQNVNDRLEASKIKVRNGGSTKRKLRLVGKSPSLLRGSYYSNNGNLPFKVPHNGNLKYIKSTSEGYDLYSIYGPNHDEGGVDIDFIDGAKIEAEGDKIRTGRNKRKLRLGGEYMLDTKDNAYFISQHDIAGVNPAELVDRGMHPLQAYAIQEQLKAIKGISDDGKHNSSPVEKKLLGGEPNPIYNMYNQVGPQMGVDTLGDTTVGVAHASNADTKRRLRCGGKARRKAETGLKVGNRYWDWSSGNWVTASDEKGYSGPVLYENQPTTVPAGTVVNVSAPSSTTTTQSQPKQNFWSRAGSWINNNAGLVGAGISGLGNLGGAWITSRGNLAASRTLAGAYNNAANIMADAYRSLSTIDMNSIRKEDYAAAHAMPALQAPVSFAAQQIAKVDRQLQRRLENAGRYSASSAAAQRRMSLAEVDAQDMRNGIYAADQEQMQRIREGNADRVSQAAMRNAELDTQANQQYASAYLNLLQYNNDIENQKILGAAGALSEGATNGAGAIANAQTANATAWSQAMLNSSQGFANSLANMSVRRADLAKVMLGASGDSQASYYANSELSSTAEAKAKYDELYTQWEAVKNSTKEGDKDTAAILKRRINAIASARGFRMITD